MRLVPGFVQQHRQWLIETLVRMQAEQATHTQLLAPDRLHLPALDEQWQLEYQPATRNSYQQCAGNDLLVQHRDEEWPRILQAWLAERARQTLTPGLFKLADELGFVCNGVTIRGQKTRWGSCSTKKNINLNWRLLFLSAEQVHYLMVHELCHTVHMNHSKSFWALVESKLPNYQEIDKTLRKASRQVPVWAL